MTIKIFKSISKIKGILFQLIKNKKKISQYNEEMHAKVSQACLTRIRSEFWSVHAS